mgnify:FL=1
MTITELSKLYNEWNNLKKNRTTFGNYIIEKTNYNFLEYTRFIIRCNDDILLFNFLMVYSSEE